MPAAETCETSTSRKLLLKGLRLLFDMPERIQARKVAFTSKDYKSFYKNGTCTPNRYSDWKCRTCVRRGRGQGKKEIVSGVQQDIESNCGARY